MFSNQTSQSQPQEAAFRKQGLIREAVGVFTDSQALAAAVAELEATSFPRHDISVLQSGGPMSSRRAEDDPNAPRTILVRPEERTIASGVIIGGGAYAGAITAAMITTSANLAAYLFMIFFGMLAGASLGGLIVYLLAVRYRELWDATVERGGMVLWVRTPDAEDETLACKIMRKHGGMDIHIHDIN